MFDNISYKGGEVNHSVTFNSVAGTLVKSTPKSKIIRFHSTSKMAKMFFDEEKPYRKQDDYPYTVTYVDVLQVMLCGDGEFLVEYLDILDDEVA